MNKTLTGRVYDIQGFSVQDGPGIRTTVFLKGCPLRCPWCHSPESQEFYKQLSWISLRCIGIELCGKCLDACDKAAVSAGKRVVQGAQQQEISLVSVNRTLCVNCDLCSDVCYPHALYICGEDYTVQRLLERVLRDKPFYEGSGGGVTISGGEPLCQPEFVLTLLKALKEQGIHTAVDTTGFVSSEIIEQVLPYTNLFLYDLKHMNSNEHQIMVKVPNEKILSNARLIAKTDIENVIINEAIYYHLLKKEQVKLGVDAEDSARTAALIVVSIYRSCTDLHRLNEVAPNNQLKLERLYRVCLDFIWDGFYESLRQGRTPIPVFPLAPEHNSFYEKTFKESCALVAM